MKAINGYDEYYIDRFGIPWSKKSGELKALKPSPDSNGYPRISLRNNGECRQVKIHRLVALAFIPNPENKRTVNHKNGIVSDNRIENLEWATYSEQQRHSFDVLGKTPTYKGMFGDDHNRSKAVLMFDKSGNVLRYFGSQGEAARFIDVYPTNISKCCIEKWRTSGGYYWDFFNSALDI